MEYLTVKMQSRTNENRSSDVMYCETSILYMKKTVWLLLTGLFCSLNLSMADNDPSKKGAGIQFTNASWAEILKKAKAENKVIFLDAYASWCGPCKLLQKNVFTRQDIGELYNKQFINVKMDMEKGEGPALAQRYPLEAYPTLFFIDGNGRVLRKVIGYQTPAVLLSIGKSVLEPGL